MTIQEAVNWCNSQVGKGLDFDGLYGAQCVDFFNFYYQFITGRSPFQDASGVAGAKDLWSVNWPNFTKVANNPNDPNQLPPQGAILIYDGALPGSGGYGHVAVVDYATTSQVMVWDQNWGGQYVHHQFHGWTGHEIGWLIFNGFEQDINLDQLTQLYHQLLSREPDQSGIATYVGHFTYDYVANAIKGSPEYAQLHAPQPPALTVVQAPVPTPEPAPQPGPAPTPAPVIPPVVPAPQPTPTPTVQPTPEPPQTTPKGDNMKGILSTLKSWLLAVWSMPIVSRAVHTFWQAFLAVFIVGISPIMPMVLGHSYGDAKTAVLSLIGAAVAAGLSAAKTVVVMWWQSRKS